MIMELTYTIVVKQVINTDLAAGYEDPNDPTKCASNQLAWLNDGLYSLEDIDMTKAEITVTGKELS